jgi:hypothetical protein
MSLKILLKYDNCFVKILNVYSQQLNLVRMRYLSARSKSHVTALKKLMLGLIPNDLGFSKYFKRILFRLENHLGGMLKMVIYQTCSNVGRKDNFQSVVEMNFIQIEGLLSDNCQNPEAISPVCHSYPTATLLFE